MYAHHREVVLCSPPKEGEHKRSGKLLHILDEFVATIELVKEHAETGEARREQDDITRFCKLDREIKGLMPMLENASQRVGNTLALYFSLESGY